MQEIIRILFHNLFLYWVGVGGIKRYWLRLIDALRLWDADQWDEDAKRAYDAVLAEELPPHVPDQLHMERGTKMIE